MVPGSSWRCWPSASTGAAASPAGGCGTNQGRNLLLSVAMSNREGTVVRQRGSNQFWKPKTVDDQGRPGTRSVLFSAHATVVCSGRRLRGGNQVESLSRSIEARCTAHPSAAPRLELQVESLKNSYCFYSGFRVDGTITKRWLKWTPI